MSVRTRADRALTVVLSLLFLPGAVVEESLHALGGLAAGAWVQINVNPFSGTAETLVQFREGTPAWAVRATYMLPELVAGVAGAAVIAWWALGGAMWWPSTTLDWLLLCILGAQYLAIAIPSAADLSHTPTGGEE